MTLLSALLLSALLFCPLQLRSFMNMSKIASLVTYFQEERAKLFIPHPFKLLGGGTLTASYVTIITISPTITVFAKRQVVR